MKKKRFRCRCCHKMCTERVRGQKYCSEVRCQRARKNTWYREKCAGDPDYRANQRASNQSWLESQGGSAAYFRKYRRRHKLEAAKSTDTDHDPEDLGDGSKIASGAEIKGLCKSAKLDVVFGKKPLNSGRYIMIRDHPASDAKLDATLVEIAIISTG